MKHYDYVLVGSGLFTPASSPGTPRGRGRPAWWWREAGSHGGEIVYCEDVEGIHVHKYGAHIFHTSSRRVWDFVNSLAEFNRYTNSPVANYSEIARWGISTPQEAREIIERQRAEIAGEPRNLEEQAIRLVGREIYEKLVKGYTEKQWGRDCRELPAFIIRRLPVRYTYDNNYFNDLYQGIPIGGYNVIIDKLFADCDVELGKDYLENKEYYDSLADHVVYTGPIDAYYGWRFGKLEYRSLRFETEILEEENHQGVAVVNYTDRETPYTRIIEHKHFEFGTQPKTVITKEYPVTWEEGMEPYYPVNDEKNQALYQKYAALAEKEPKVIFGGRLGEYKYYDMDKVIASAMEKAEKIFKNA